MSKNAKSYPDSKRAAYEDFRSPEHQPVCSGVVLKDRRERYLLVLGRDANKWSFPKGHIESGESWKSCARREAYEETGLIVVIPRKARYRFTRKSIYFLLNADCVTNDIMNVRPRDTNEIKMAQWFSRDMIIKFSREQVNTDLWEFVKALKWVF